jgi:hypothetical protein
MVHDNLVCTLKVHNGARGHWLDNGRAMQRTLQGLSGSGDKPQGCDALNDADTVRNGNSGSGLGLGGKVLIGHRQGEGAGCYQGQSNGEEVAFHGR